MNRTAWAGWVACALVIVAAGLLIRAVLDADRSGKRSGWTGDDVGG